MPHILHLCGWYYPDSIGGTEAYVHSLCCELMEMGYAVTVAAPSADETEGSYVHKGVDVFRYPVSIDPDRREITGTGEPRFFDRFEGLLRDIDPDIVHMHSFTRGCGTHHARLVKSLGKPLVYTAHLPGTTCARGTMMRWGRVPCDGEMRLTRCTACSLHVKGAPLPLAWLLALVPDALGGVFEPLSFRWATAVQMRLLTRRRTGSVRTFLSLCDHILAVSEWLSDVITTNGVNEEKVSVSLHGLPPGLLESRSTAGGRDANGPMRVGYIGRFAWVKGVHLLIDSLRHLGGEVPVELVIYGRANDEEERDYLKGLVSLAEGDVRIKFCGELTEENRAEVFGSMDILAVPSLWMETGPFVVLEAFASGVPVMGHGFGGVAERVRDGVDGMFVEPTSEAWAEALAELSTDRERVEALAASVPGIRTVREVALDNRAVYEGLLV